MKNYLYSQSLLFQCFTFLLLLFLGLFCFSISITAAFDHDEHQFVASGAILLREGLLPYLDYPYFHLPNLTFIYALAFTFSDYLLLTARTISALSFSGVLILIFLKTTQIVEQEKDWVKVFVGLAALGFIIPNAVVLYTAGKAWNHSLPLLLTFISYLYFLKSWKTQEWKRNLFWSGLWLSLAIGTRISFATMIIPSLIGIFFFDKLGKSEKWRAIFTFGIGGVVGMLPSIILFVATPQAFLFDVFTYHLEVDTQYFLANEGGLSFQQRWDFFYKNITIGRNWHLTRAAILFFIIAIAFNLKSRQKLFFPFFFTATLIPFSILSSFSKTVFFYQYLFVPIPFLVMMVVFAIAAFPVKFRKFGIGLFCLLAAFTILKKDTPFWKLRALWETEKWVPFKMHTAGEKLAEHCTNGKVLTLAPILPLEGKAQIYPAFTTGPFAWRTSSLVPKENRELSKIISPLELNDLLEQEPPVAILTGYEWKNEDDFICYARKAEYEELPFLVDKNLFLERQKVEKRLVKMFSFESDTSVFQFQNKYSPNLEGDFSGISEHPPIHISASLHVFSENLPQTDSLCLVFEIKDKQKQTIAWEGRRVMDCEWEEKKWNRIAVNYQLIDTVFQDYTFKTYLWNISQLELEIKEFKVEMAQ